MRHTTRRAQHGAALIVGLVLLLVLTILAVSGMTTGVLEIGMANNMQQRQHAFRAAESAIDVTMDTFLPVYRPGMERGARVAPDRVVTYAPEGETLATTDVSTRFVTTNNGLGWELGATRALHFEVVADARTEVRDARSEQRAGFSIVVQ